MKNWHTNSTTKRRCLQCKKSTGEGIVFAENNIEVRLPICCDCQIAFNANTDGLKTIFPVIKEVLKK
jgi:hypothetical protein